MQMEKMGVRYRGPMMKGKPLAYGIWYVLLPHAEKKVSRKYIEVGQPG